MIAHVGDRIVIEGTHLGDGRRVGVITDVAHPDGSPPYRVRWEDTGDTTLIFPGVEAHLQVPGHGEGSS